MQIQKMQNKRVFQTGRKKKSGLYVVDQFRFTWLCMHHIFRKLVLNLSIKYQAFDEHLPLYHIALHIFPPH